MAKRLVYPILSFLSLISCGSEGEDGSSSGITTEMAYARMFSITRHDNSTTLAVYASQEDDRRAIAEFTIGQGSGELNTRDFRRWATMSTTHLPYFKQLGMLDELVACAFLEHVLDSKVAQMVADDRISELAKGNGVDKEQLVVSNPDLVFAYPFGSASEQLASIFDGPVFPVTEYLEEHPLGRAEWIRFFGVLFGKEELADSLFNTIVHRYDSVRQEVMLSSYKPKVFFGSYWNGEWHVSGGNSYIARLIKDAGCSYMFANDPGQTNISVGLEQLIEQSSTMTHFGRILHVPGSPNAQDLFTEDERISDLVIHNGTQVFYTNSAQDDVFGVGILEPDVMLSELFWLTRMGKVKRADSSGDFRYFHPFEQ